MQESQHLFWQHVLSLLQPQAWPGQDPRESPRDWTCMAVLCISSMSHHNLQACEPAAPASGFIPKSAIQIHLSSMLLGVLKDIVYPVSP